MLRGLLAVIHGDGGHYTERVGLHLSVRHAQGIVAEGLCGPLPPSASEVDTMTDTIDGNYGFEDEWKGNLPNLDDPKEREAEEDPRRIAGRKVAAYLREMTASAADHFATENIDEYGPRPWRKRPVTITAKRMREAFEVKTLEGTMKGKPGDWLITGVEGEQYPCDDAIFRKTYQPVVWARTAS